MCGLAGVVDFTRPAAAHAARLAAMQALLRHRGPDGEGAYAAAHVSLAHTRLAILDREGGAQPMVSPDGRYVVVYNGELANANELRAVLDWTFRTRSDTEVVLASYARWGAACVARLSGMFAFFVWDTQRACGMGARDRLGVKPLLFSSAPDGRSVVFASEAHVIARTSHERARANVAGVLEVLVAPCFSGVAHSMFEGIVPLPPAHVLFVDRDGVRTEAYWDWPCGADHERDDDPQRVVSALRDEVPRAIERALSADVPIGLFSSGGLDSAMIAATMAARAAAPVPAYTVTFDDQARFAYGPASITTSDDTPFARDVAVDLGLDPRLVHVRRDEIAHDLRAVAIANDALPAWEQEIAQHRLARGAASSLKAVVVGDAADETHYGYHFLLDAGALRGPEVVLRRHGSVPIQRSVSADPVADASAELVALAASKGADFAADARRRVLAMTYLVVKRWLPRLLHNGDIHTMHASLEARVPFADSRLVELAASVSPAVALRGGTEKWALRESARGRIPEHVRTRKKSALPKDLAVEPVYRSEAVNVLREPPAVLRALVDTAAVQAIATRDTPLTEAERGILFRVITLAHWARHHEVAAP
jgi:asparagine synthase (glutamine-hydrolysing)